jgi:hypothetical protein
MKKTAIVPIFIILLIAGCSNAKNGGISKDGVGKPINVSSGGIYEIKENMFLTQISDIVLNYKDYLGKTIKLEGLFFYEEWDGNIFYRVIRGAPGCCGDDGEAGFEVSWNPSFDGTDDGSDMELYPKKSDWVEAQGKLCSYEKYGFTFLYLALSEINVLEKRGALFVSR